MCVLMKWKMKDETNGVPIREFIGLRCKCYSILEYDNHDKKVAKGVPRIAIKNQLTHEKYKDCLFNCAEKLTTALTIRSEKHQIYTQKISKLSLSPFDSKRYVLENGQDTWAYGHYRIKNRKSTSSKDSETVKRPKI